MVLVVIKENHFEIHFEGKNIIPFTCACVSCRREVVWTSFYVRTGLILVLYSAAKRL